MKPLNLTPYFVADSNMPHSWWDFLGDNRVERPEHAHIVFHTDAFIGPTDHPNSVAILIESQAVHPHAYTSIQKYHQGYKAVLTFDVDTLKLPNAHMCFFGGGWVAKEDWRVYPKTQNLCMTLSAKRFTDGHQMRHQVYERVRGRLDGAHGFMNPIPNTLTGVRDFRFNVCVENTRKDFYFSEKILDCFSAGTVPLYWGCPSIGDFFDIEGILPFSNTDELEDQLRKCTPEYYEAIRPKIEENMRRTAEYWSYEDNIIKALRVSNVNLL